MALKSASHLFNSASLAANAFSLASKVSTLFKASILCRACKTHIHNHERMLDKLLIGYEAMQEGSGFALQSTNFETHRVNACAQQA